MFILCIAGEEDFLVEFLIMYVRSCENLVDLFNNVCSNVIVQGLTILAPVTSPNTDGINPGM